MVLTRQFLEGGLGIGVEGSSVRGLCGAYFVPCRDDADMPVCSECQRRYDALPK
jgi:hypothetical protein